MTCFTPGIDLAFSALKLLTFPPNTGGHRRPDGPDRSEAATARHRIEERGRKKAALTVRSAVCAARSAPIRDQGPMMGDEHTTRNPTPLLRLLGRFLSRKAQRAKSR